VYSTSQFLGAFAGGVAGGGIYGSYGIEGVFGFSIIMTAVWVFLAKTMEKPQYLSGYMIKVGTIDASQASLIENRLKQQAGVAEATVNVEDGVAYLKVDSRVADTDDLHTVVADLTNLPAPDESPGLQRS